MQGAVVLHHHTVTGRQPEHQLQLIAQQQLRKLAVSLVPGLGHISRRIQPVGRTVVEVHRLEHTFAVGRYQGLPGAQIGMGVGIAKVHRHRAQQLKRRWVLLAQQLSRGKTIHQQGVTAWRLGLQAMQQLHTR